MRWLGTIGIGAVWLASWAGPVDAQTDEPLRTRNLSPPVAIFAMPSWQPLPDDVRAGSSLELANHYRLSRRGADFLLLDGETLRLNLHAEKRVRPLWSVAIEAPFFRQSGGVLDDVIDGWHSVFEMPDGGRNGRPEGALEYRLGRGTDQMIALVDTRSGIGDVTLSAARALGTLESFTLRFSLKLPTGDVDLLSGSGASDVMATLLYDRTFVLRRRNAGFYWGAGLVSTGTPDRIRLPREDLVFTGLVGGSVSLRERLGFRAQLEIHSAYYDTPLEELGQTAVQASLGGWWSIGRRGRFDFAISEDLHVSTAPDVAIHAGVQWLW